MTSTYVLFICFLIYFYCFIAWIYWMFCWCLIWTSVVAPTVCCILSVLKLRVTRWKSKVVQAFIVADVTEPYGIFRMNFFEILCLFRRVYFWRWWPISCISFCFVRFACSQQVAGSLLHNSVARHLLTMDPISLILLVLLDWNICVILWIASSTITAIGPVIDLPVVPSQQSSFVMFLIELSLV